MKILQINSVSDYGSTGRNIIELTHYFHKRGNKVFIAYGHGSSSHSASHKVGGVIENHFHNLYSRVFGLHGYCSKQGTRKLIKYIEDIDPDVIHLNNLHIYYLNFELLFQFLVKFNKPIVWTLHDCWAFTGRCSHYTVAKCYKWQSSCTSPCPVLKTHTPSLFFDRTDKMFKDKARWFTALPNVEIVTVSDWLKEEVKKSYLSKYRIRTIYNWVDHGTFKQMEVLASDYTRLCIPFGKRIVLAITAHWEGTKLEDVIKLAGLLKNDQLLLVIGNLPSKINLPSNVIHIKYVHSIDTLVLLYNIADVYIHLSTEDTFGKVIVEAMSCGTPVVGYQSTAIPEVIGDGSCGYTVEPRNIIAFNEKVQYILKAGKYFYSKECRERVLSEFDIEKNLHKYERLYKEIT